MSERVRIPAAIWGPKACSFKDLGRKSQEVERKLSAIRSQFRADERASLGRRIREMNSARGGDPNKLARGTREFFESERRFKQEEAALLRELESLLARRRKSGPGAAAESLRAAVDELSACIKQAKDLGLEDLVTHMRAVGGHLSIARAAAGDAPRAEAE